MQDTVNQRLIFLVDELAKGNSKDFAKAVGLPYGTFQNYVNPNKLSMPSAEVVAKVLKAYPEINANWLLTGDGEAFEQAVKADQNYKVLYDKSEAEVGFLRQQLAKLTDSVHFLSKSVKQG